MKLYQNTEQERTLTDRLPLPSLHGLPLPDLCELQKNLEEVLETGWLFGSDLLVMAIDMDLKKVDRYIKMHERKHSKQ